MGSQTKLDKHICPEFQGACSRPFFGEEIPSYVWESSSTIGRAQHFFLLFLEKLPLGFLLDYRAYSKLYFRKEKWPLGFVDMTHIWHFLIP